MWNYPDAETLEWTKNLKVKGKILGDGSALTNLPIGTESDPIWVAASAALHANVATVSGAITNKFNESSGALTYLNYQITSGAYIVHAADNTIHYINPGFLTSETDPIWTAASAALFGNIATVSGAVTTKYSESSGALTYTSYRITSGAYIAHAADASDPHGATLTQTNAVITSCSGASMFITGDKATASYAYVANIVHTSGALGAIASNYPIGSLWVQYTG